MMERYALAKTRVGEIPEEQEAAQPYLDFFQKTAGFLLKTIQVMEKTGEQSLEELQTENRVLYEDILPENYKTSYGNPAYAAEKLGEY